MRLLAFCMFIGALGAVPAAAHEVRSGDLVISHPHSPPAPGAARNAAVFMTIINEGAVADTLLSASSPVAEAVEIHDNRAGDDGVMRMRRIESVEVSPGAPSVLAPGGLHIMLIGLNMQLVEEEMFPLTLVFEKAGAITVDVHVTPHHNAEGMPERPADHSGHTGH